ncbi:MAG: hypothetical protein RLZZ127_504, partial [Planctomycetota bacterium]
MRLSACLLACAIALPAADPALRALPLEDQDTVTAVDMLRLRLVLDGALVKADKDGKTSGADLELTAVRERGAWSLSGLGAPGYNKGSHRGTGTPEAGAGGIVLDIAARIGDDQWVKGDPDARYRVELATAADGTVSGRF